MKSKLDLIIILWLWRYIQIVELFYVVVEDYLVNMYGARNLEIFFFPLNYFAQILCYKIGNPLISFYPTFLWKINFTLVRRLISALIWDISGLGNRSDGRDFREKRIVISRSLVPYMLEWGSQKINPYDFKKLSVLHFISIFSNLNAMNVAFWRL